MLNYQLEGVRLTASITEAIKILEKRGYTLEDDGTDHNQKSIWHFKKAPVTVEINLFHDTRKIHKIARFEKPETDSQIDIAKEVARIEASWGPNADKVAIPSS